MKTRGSILVAGAATVMMLAGCAGQGSPAAQQAGSEDKPPSTGKYIQGDWQCLTSSPDRSKENEYTYHVAVTPTSIRAGVARTGEDLYWSTFDYILSKDGTLTVTDREGSTVVWELPMDLSYTEPNTVMTGASVTTAFEVMVAADELTFQWGTDQNWVCKHGHFTDDGATFVDD